MYKKLLFIMLLIYLSMATVSINAATYFKANLTGAQQILPNDSAANGFGRVTLNDAEDQITVSVYYGNPIALSGSVTAGHIHLAGTNLSGPVLFDLKTPPGFTVGEVVNLEYNVTPAQVEELKAGLWYFNIHTSTYPNGEIRGQISVDSPYVAYLDNNQVIPPTNFAASGGGFVSLNEATRQALISMNWSGKTDPISSAQIREGQAGINGRVVCDLGVSTKNSGSLVDAICTLDEREIKALKSGQFYLNLNSESSPDGALRGQIQRRASAVCDYDGDGITDAAITRAAFPFTEWWIRNSRDASTSVYTFGTYNDFFAKHMVCGDFDGDGKDDVALWRSANAPNAFFYILQSGSYTVREVQFGTTGDDPRIVEDYDGDGVTDIAVFRPADGTWYYMPSANNPERNVVSVRWGTAYANPGDYDGDGRADFVDHQGSNWWILNSRDLSVKMISFGPDLVFGAPGDFDGDGKIDIAVVSIEKQYKTWYYRSSLNPNQNPYLTRKDWGKIPLEGPIPQTVQGDYDGDGKTDYAVYVQTEDPNDHPKFWVAPSNGGNPIVIAWGEYNWLPSYYNYPIASFNNR